MWEAGYSRTIDISKEEIESEVIKEILSKSEVPDYDITLELPYYEFCSSPLNILYRN